MPATGTVASVPAEVHRGPRSQAQLAGGLLGDPRPVGRAAAPHAGHVVERPGRG